MSVDFEQIIRNVTIERLISEYPVVRDFFQNMNLPPVNHGKTLVEAIEGVADEWFYEFGFTRLEIPARLADFLRDMTLSESVRTISSLRILGGKNKLGEEEEAELTIGPGDVVSIVGPTGSGKSRLLADIECLAQGDTPTRRRILIDGEPVSEEARFRLDGKIVAQLSQNMNFVMDLTVEEFLEMHARSRSSEGDPSGMRNIVGMCFERANDLAGEKFTPDTKVTLLSGGQSRALMIADCAYMSKSPIVLIDEIENAGVDRREAIALLARREKIVLISTHDPLLALGADKRIVIRNGGIYKILETSEAERRSLRELERLDRLVTDTRKRLRAGEQLILEQEAFLCGNCMTSSYPV